MKMLIAMQMLFVKALKLTFKYNELVIIIPVIITTLYLLTDINTPFVGWLAIGALGSIIAKGINEILFKLMEYVV